MKNAWARWTLLIGGGLFAAALIGAGALFYLVSRLDVRAEVERAVEDATGRDLVISGNVGVSLWPVLGLRAEDAQLANVRGGRAPALIAMDEIHVGVELRPLLNQDVVVRQLVLDRPRIALEVDAQGRPNWILRPVRTGPTPAPDAPPVESRQFTLRDVSINAGEVSYFDARRGTGWVVGDAHLRTSIESLSEPMRMRGEVLYNDDRVKLDISVAQPGAAMTGRLSDVSVEVESNLLNASFEGRTTAMSGEVAGAVQASGPSLRQLASWVGVPVLGGSGLDQFSVTGQLAMTGGTFAFSDAGFAVDRLQGRGDFTLSENRGKPYLSGRLQLFDFDLNPYLSGERVEPTAPVEAPSADAPAPPSAQTTVASTPTAEIAAVEAAPRTVDIAQAPSATPIAFSGLRAINADLELTTGVVLVQHMRIDRAQLTLVLNDGFVAATLHNMSLYGGSGRGRFEIDARQDAVRMVQDMTFSGIDAQPFLSDVINFGNIEGRGEVSFLLRTEGATQSEIISSADGRIHLEIVSGVLHGVDLGGVSRTIRNALRGELIAPEARTPFHGFSATFAVADGVLASDNLSFNTPQLAIPGMGVIDLNARRLDVRMAPRAAGGGGIVVPFSARGPFGGLAYDSDIRGRARAEIEPRVRAVQQASRAQ